jgi:thiosulfate/3-mercaptopyruvate sulfurtransferase
MELPEEVSMIDDTAPPFGPLVSTEWLERHLADSSLRLADCRWYLGEPDHGRREYDRGHLPGAVYVSLDDDLSAPEGPGRHPLPDAESIAARLGDLGFGDDSVVVAYDDRGGAVASRMWWMLRSIGHRNVAVLDGGLTAWRTEGRPLRTDATTRAPQRLTVRRQPQVIDAARLADRLGTVTLIDARDGDRYRGEREPIDPVAGHIPTAINVPMSGNLGDDHRFLEPDVLRARFEASTAPDTEIVVYCGSGVTACHDILAMEIAGFPPATLYAGSWSDWSSSDRPVRTGDEPGTR